MPVASGSSVPAWPAFCALNSRRTFDTASVEVISYVLSRQIQPCTGSPFFVRPMVSFLVFVFAVVVTQVASDLGPHEQGVDARRLVEALVVQEAQVRRE